MVSDSRNYCNVLFSPEAILHLIDEFVSAHTARTPNQKAAKTWFIQQGTRRETIDTEQEWFNCYANGIPGDYIVQIGVHYIAFNTFKSGYGHPMAHVEIRACESRVVDQLFTSLEAFLSPVELEMSQRDDYSNQEPITAISGGSPANPASNRGMAQQTDSPSIVYPPGRKPSLVMTTSAQSATVHLHTNLKPSVFIASSVENKPIAQWLQVELDHTAEVTIWNQNVFTPSGVTVDDLSCQLQRSDFAVLVLAPNDQTHMRKETLQTARDNVILELGLCIGILGRTRTFMLVPRDVDNYHLPTDVWGLTPVTYAPNRRDGNLQAALGAPSQIILEAMRRLGLRGRSDED